MRRVLFLFTLSTCVISAMPAGAQELDAETKILFGAPGDLTFDASDLKTVFPAPAEPLKFETWADFYAFAEKYLNAIPVMEEGEQVGVEGAFEMVGQGVIPDGATETLFEVDNPITAYLTGKAGYIIVDGEPFCISEDDCEATLGAPSGMTTILALGDEIDAQPVCDAEEENCAEFLSVNIHRLFWDVARGRTTQTRGGYQANNTFCWKFGFIPWSCSEQLGSNELRVRVRLCPNDGRSWRDVPKRKTNTDRVQWGLWAIGQGMSSMAAGSVGTRTEHLARGEGFWLDQPETIAGRVLCF